MADKDDASLEGFTQEEAIAMGLTYAKLAKDPATREIVLRATKKVAPGTSIPEIDILDRVTAATKPLVDELEARKKSDIDRDNAERLREARAALKDSGYDGEEIKAIEELMLAEKKEGNVLTHKKAAEFFRLQQRTAQPMTSAVRQNTMPVDKKSIKEAGGIRKWGATEAGKAIDDMRAGRVKFH